MVNFRRFLQVAGAMSVSALLVACQSANNPDGSAVDFGVGGDNAPAEERITDVEARAFCPKVLLREGTAYFNTYTKGNEENLDEVIYQATLVDVTRSCTYNGGMIAMTVTAAGRVVPGPQGRSGTITMPIRVAVVNADGPIYSELRKMDVSIDASTGAQQFLFQDNQISFPQPSDRVIQVFVGFDEGPYDTP